MADDDKREEDEREPETGDGNESETDDADEQGDVEAQLARMKRALAKANREAASNRKKLAAFEDRDKTDTERASEKLTAAEKRAAQAEAKLLRLEVAARKGLPPELALRLQGEDQDELEADADELAKLIKGDRGKQSSGRRDPDQGKGNGQADSDDPDMNDWMRRAAGVRAE